MNEYPSDADLEVIAAWPYTNLAACFDFIRDRWWMPEWGWHEERGWDGRSFTRYEISTGGWSGNESLIEAMEQNHMLMALSWVQSRRGGHYIFELHDELASFEALAPNTTEDREEGP